jgi:hypothetical protein
MHMHMHDCIPAPRAQASDAGDAAALQQLLDAAGLAESKLRRRALEITFLPNGVRTTAYAVPGEAGPAVTAAAGATQTVEEDEEEMPLDGAAAVAAAAAAAVVAAEEAEFSSFLEAANRAADEALGAQGDGGGGSSGGGDGGAPKVRAPRLPVPKGDTAALGSKRQRIAEAPADIAAQLGLPLERWVGSLLAGVKGERLALHIARSSSINAAVLVHTHASRPPRLSPLLVAPAGCGCGCKHVANACTGARGPPLYTPAAGPRLLCRSERLLLRAMRGIPLAHDRDDPVQVRG